MSQVTLDYEQGSRRWRRPVLAGWALLVMLGVAGGTLAFVYRERIALQYQVLQDQRFIVHYEANHESDPVLYETPAHSDIQTLWKQWDRVAAQRVAIAGQNPFSQFAASPARVPYMGERMTPDGVRRIVVVERALIQTWEIEGWQATTPPHRFAHVRCWVFEPASFWRLPRQLTSTEFIAGKDGWAEVFGRNTLYPNMIVYAGQSNDEDPTRIDFRFTGGDRDGLLVLRLDDNDRLQAAFEFAKP